MIKWIKSWFKKFVEEVEVPKRDIIYLSKWQIKKHFFYRGEDDYMAFHINKLTWKKNRDNTIPCYLEERSGLHIQEGVTATFALSSYSEKRYYLTGVGASIDELLKQLKKSQSKLWITLEPQKKVDEALERLAEKQTGHYKFEVLEEATKGGK